MTEQPPQIPIQLGQIELPPEEAIGHHADMASIWHTPESFVIDFIAFTSPPRAPEGADGPPPFMELPAMVSARIRMAPTHVFALMRALNEELTKWEVETGRPLPQEPEPPSTEPEEPA